MSKGKEEALAEATAAYEPASQMVSSLAEVYLAEPPTTVKAQAEVEWSIWDALPKELQQPITAVNGYYATWLVHCLKGGSSSRYLAKARTLAKERSGHQVDALWVYLENLEANPTLILDAITYANARVKENPGDSEEEARDRWSKAADHYVHNPVKRASRIRKDERPKEPEVAQDDPKPEGKRQKTLEAILTDSSPEEARKVWANIQDSLQALLRPYVQQRLEGFESPSEIEQRMADFCLEVKISFDDLLLSIRRLRNTTYGKEVIEERRQKVRHALEVLRIEPKRGWSKDSLDLSVIKTAYKSRALQFHPDRTKDDPRYTERFREVQDAWNLLKNYLTNP